MLKDSQHSGEYTIFGYNAFVCIGLQLHYYLELFPSSRLKRTFDVHLKSAKILHSDMHTVQVMCHFILKTEIKKP